MSRSSGGTSAARVTETKSAVGSAEPGLGKRTAKGILAVGP